ncbi:MAG: hypothetical protein HY820_14865 [Acidobacteria bacterium]|nr:hypothetical protein [Acidobacteriota bacterium]
MTIDERIEALTYAISTLVDDAKLRDIAIARQAELIDKQIANQDERMARQGELIDKQIANQDERMARQGELIEKQIANQDERMARQDERMARQDERMARQGEHIAMLLEDSKTRSADIEALIEQSRAGKEERDQDAANIRALVRIAEIHERRLSALEGEEPE